MDASSISEALERIEVALERIENAAGQRDSESGEIRARHEKLKAAVSQSLGQLDKLIEGQSK
ncbi:MAG: hypothetical protein P8J20_06575 [Novosphingobium sp.]|nr:hypothetical protein [Novosphingobium sp.]